MVEERKTRVAQLLEKNFSYTQIAADLGVTRSAVAGWINRNGLCKNPTGGRCEVTEALILARRERHRIASLESKHRRSGKKLLNTDRRIAASPFKRRYVDVVPLNLSFDDMEFGSMCAYPTHGANCTPQYCGHGVGLKKNGKPSTYCQSHHFVAHA